MDCNKQWTLTTVEKILKFEIEYSGVSWPPPPSPFPSPLYVYLDLRVWALNVWYMISKKGP